MSVRPWNLIPGSVFPVILGGVGPWGTNSTLSSGAGYADSEAGDDSTGNGQPDAPFKTLNKAVSEGFTEIVCRGVFEENLVQDNTIIYFISDVPYGATYMGDLPRTNSERLHLQNNWMVWNGRDYYGNKGMYTSISGWIKNPEENKYLVSVFDKTHVCSSYRQDITFTNILGFAAYTGCVEGATVSFRNVNGGTNVVLKDCRVLAGNVGDIEIEITGETDEEKTESLVSQLNAMYNTTYFSGVKVTTKPIFNDPENGDLTIHPESVVLQNKIYLNSRDYYYPAALPMGISLKILPDSRGEKYAFDERSVKGYLQVTEDKTIEPVRDENGDYIDEGSIDSKVITLPRGTALKGIHLVFQNDELNSGLRLGKGPWQTLQVRYRYSLSSTKELHTLHPEAVYLNTNAFNLVLKNSISSDERVIVPGESFIIKENETLESADGNAQVGIFYDDDSGWMDCLCGTDLLVKRVGDTQAGPLDRDDEGNVLTNANPAFYSEENRERPEFPVVARYVQYRVKMGRELRTKN